MERGGASGAQGLSGEGGASGAQGLTAEGETPQPLTSTLEKNSFQPRQPRKRKPPMMCHDSWSIFITTQTVARDSQSVLETPCEKIVSKKILWLKSIMLTPDIFSILLSLVEVYCSCTPKLVHWGCTVLLSHNIVAEGFTCGKICGRKFLWLKFKMGSPRSLIYARHSLTASEWMHGWCNEIFAHQSRKLISIYSRFGSYFAKYNPANFFGYTVYANIIAECCKHCKYYEHCKLKQTAAKHCKWLCSASMLQTLKARNIVHCKKYVVVLTT